MFEIKIAFRILVKLFAVFFAQVAFFFLDLTLCLQLISGPGLGSIRAVTAPSSSVWVVSGFTAGANYQVRARVTTPSGAMGESTLGFETSSEPAGGRCSVAPTIGVAATTTFTLACSNWGATPDQIPLWYRWRWENAANPTQNMTVLSSSISAYRTTLLRESAGATLAGCVSTSDNLGEICKIWTPELFVTAQSKIEDSTLGDISSSLSTGDHVAALSALAAIDQRAASSAQLNEIAQNVVQLSKDMQLQPDTISPVLYICKPFPN